LLSVDAHHAESDDYNEERPAMGTDASSIEDLQGTRRAGSWICYLLTGLAAVVGLAILVDSLWKSSASFDEVLYLSEAARWWRTGFVEKITRAGSPLTFWKLQQAPTFWLLDRLGLGIWIDDPARHEAALLPIVRMGALWIWLLAFALTARWSLSLYGPHAMVLAAWWYALSPNLLAHGGLVTMETPILAGTAGAFFLFWVFLRTKSRLAFLGSAIVCGIAWSCKFTAVVFPPIMALLWCMQVWTDGERRLPRLALRVAGGMMIFAATMALTDVVITGFAMLPASERVGWHPSFDGKYGAALGSIITRLAETPIPQDVAAFIRQVHMQRSGAPSYLFGEIRQTGWRYYYLVALAVKVPLLFWLVMAARAALCRRAVSVNRDWILPATIIVFLALACLGSKRNFGFRYLLPVAPLAIVWMSALAQAGRWPRRLAAIGLAGQVLAVAMCHPYELTYFNALAGGPTGGRAILSDSNLDWGQGLKSLVRLQRVDPAYLDLTLYYFGGTEPSRYGVTGQTYSLRAEEPNSNLPPTLSADTNYLAVSVSLRWGPWAPPGYFKPLESIQPVRFTEDHTIALYRTDVVRAAMRLESRGETAMTGPRAP
jgi:hypothetical protein